MKSAQWFVGCESGWSTSAQHIRRHNTAFRCDASCEGVAAFNERQRNIEAVVKKKYIALGGQRRCQLLHGI